MNIITNWQPRHLATWHELPSRVQRGFDYIEAEDQHTPRFACYRGEWLDCHDVQAIEPRADAQHPVGWAMRVHPGSPLAHFDGIASDSHFSGTLVRLIDGNSVILARYFV